MKVLTINRLIKLVQCLLILVTIVLVVSGFNSKTSLHPKKEDKEISVGVHNGSNFFAMVGCFITTMVYIGLIMMEYWQVLMLTPAVAFIRLALLSKYPEPYLSQSLLAIFITHVVMSITLTLLLRLKAIIRSISTMNRIDYDSDDNDDQCDDRQVLLHI